ncbi:GNAT family N-acetyltransferase [Alkalicoccus luteus]|uniref:GNAT family N-acetyltransferase n=1 Tax=Alkalicoccus luteus TaxID=1237094 RepID=A0A969TWF6_9BACI|nr:GNAT family N-acetyltransferase [Alkalicoccus luteus]NJP39400.1 GNAT family N-acetyltransferase [Alkalicoccus luteus]
MEAIIECRSAVSSDLEAVVSMLADDVLGKEREQYVVPLLESYRHAFEAIEADPNNELIVACYKGEVVGVQQLTFTPYITHQGGWRATIEGVRTSLSIRGKGSGSELITWGIERAKERQCHLRCDRKAKSSAKLARY